MRAPVFPIKPQQSESAALELCTTNTDSPLSTPDKVGSAEETDGAVGWKETPPRRELDGATAGAVVRMFQLRQADCGDGGRREAGVVYGCMNAKENRQE